MTEQSTELILIRHAPIATPGILCGRTDVAARIDDAAIAALRAVLPEAGDCVTSPALRCRQTAEALWPETDSPTDARLWEQDFGAHDGLPFAKIPDIGRLSPDALAGYAPPEGESFLDLCARVTPALQEHAATAHAQGRPRILVVHAGVIRAALGITLGHAPAGLGFEVPTLSMTRLRTDRTGPVSVIETGRVAT